MFGKKAFLLALLALGVFGLKAEDTHPKENNEEFDATEVIMHHIKDAHEWHLVEIKGENGESKQVSIPLPVILYYKGHLDVFMSSKFHHGNADVVCGSGKDQRIYRLSHGHIEVVTEGEEKHAEHSAAKPLDFSITKNVASMMVSAVLLLGLFIPIGRKYKAGKLVPSGAQSFMEPIVLFIRDDIAKPNIGHHKYEKYLPYLLTVFFFIWFNNMLGLFPGGANLTGNIAVTMVLALMTMFITNFSGNKNYWKHILAPPVPKWLWFIMIPVELIGVLSKPFALMIRLFANITAGHIIMLSLISLIFIFKTVWISPVSIAFVLFMDILELLVAILQAYIFTLLSALFIGLAVQEHHH